MPTSTHSRLYALLVGIDTYATPVSALRGCVRDVQDMEQYLTFNSGFENVQILKLLNREATREGLIDGFRKHLAQAGENDTVFFHYSGHGTQEKADRLVWKDETDEALETLVLYNGGARNYADFLFTDKELRYLIYELYQATKAHIVTIFDCCHSGDNTRNGALVQASYQKASPRRITKEGTSFPQRQWGDFLFGSQISKQKAIVGSTEDVLPQGVYIQLAACESNQVAMEVNGQGVFTKALLKTLRDSGGNISYNVLRSRVRQYLRTQFEQTPRIYAPMNAERLLACGFLNRDTLSESFLCEATKNPVSGWQLNVGALHGVKSDSPITLTALDGKIYAAKVRDNGIFIDYTLLDLPALPDETIPYKAKVTGLLASELILELDNHDATPVEAGELMNELEKQAGGGFSFGGEAGGKANEKDSGKTEEAHYTLHLHNGDAYLTLPGDPYRPLTEPIDYLGEAGDDGFVTVQEKENSRRKIAKTLKHISRWHFIRNLQNPASPKNFPKQPLLIEISRLKPDGAWDTIEIYGGAAQLEYQKVDGDWTGAIRIRITNTTRQNLYVAAVYLGKGFQSFLKFIPTRVQLLESGKTISLGLEGSDRINLRLGDVEQEYNWEQVREAIQFIVSTVEFNAEALTLEALPNPLTLSERTRKGITRSLVTDEDERVQFTGWATQTLELIFKNPVYNKVSLHKIKALLEWEETAHFAAGLYTEVENDEHGFPTLLTLKKGIVVPEDERSMLGDAKLWLGNNIATTTRWFKYQKLKKDPNRLRLVAEGDSWFQYPILLKDTLDHLYKRYAVRSFAEAGDTLENYLKKKEYLRSIGKENAGFFLVSGGGNDVVGDEFPAFLKKKAEVNPNDPGPGKYLNMVTFTSQLDKLEKWYDQMFTELLNKYPHLKIMVHSYDYVLPVDPRVTPEKSSWSGKYMVDPEIAIEPQSEREALIRHILDLFAERLRKLAGDPKFGGNVIYINTFGLVPRDQWFDEIHPTNAGYEIVAGKFIENIERPILTPDR